MDESLAGGGFQGGVMRLTGHRPLFLPAAVLLLLLPATSFAQRGSAPAASVPRVMSAPRASSGNITITVNNNNNSPSFPINTLPSTAFNFIPVPGLGFDIPHLAATRGAAAVGGVPGQFIPGTTSAGFLGFGAGAIFPTAGAIVIQAPPIVIQQPVIIQQPVVVAPAPETPEPPRVEERKPAAREESREVVRETPEYIFIRRDGTVLFAVAYIVEKDHLDCVTRDGHRRTVALAALDLDATKKFNEERGLTFRLPT